MGKRKSPSEEGLGTALWYELRETISIPFNHICNEMPRDKIAEAIFLLNNGLVWSEELPGKPADWERMDAERKSYIRDNIVCAAEITIGKKAIDRYYWQNMRGYSEQEFEDFWQSGHFDLLYEKTEQSGSSCHCGYTERDNGRYTQKTILPVLIGSILGNLLGSLIVLLLKITGIL